MFKYRRIILRILIISGIVYFCITNFVFANPLDNWQNSRSYKPNPVLFLHGFGRGSSNAWNPAKTTLGKYFSQYQRLGTYLEIINFQDPNGSVDTYDPGKLNPQGNSDGWADKLEDKINELLASNKYGSYTNRINLVCHSMGGLAARWYLVNYSSNFVDKLILIGVPNLGSPWANLANDIAKAPKFGWLVIMPHAFVTAPIRHGLEGAVDARLAIEIEGEAAKDMTAGSQFLQSLNSRMQPSDVDFYGICGIIGNPLNWYISGDYYGGDGVVTKISQLGTSLKDSTTIYAIHWREPEIAAKETDNKILKFFDSTKPEFEITYPGAGTTDIYESSIHIQGKVYKEYLPADSQLIINVTREADGYALPVQISFLKPSDLWQPNNPSFPVAEFDEVINFPGNGTYKISCQVKNPAGITSDVKIFWVKVVTAGANIIVHCHNPEEKEIASIQGISQNDVEIYDGDTKIGYGAYNADTHNQPIAISAGTHTIKAKFNGMIKEQTLTFNPNETKVAIFTFERTFWNGNIGGQLITGDYYSSISGSFDGYYPDTWSEDVKAGVARTSVRFGESTPNQAGTFSMEAKMTIDISPGRFYIISEGCNTVIFTRGNWEIPFPYNHANSLVIFNGSVENFLIQRTDTGSITRNFNIYHYLHTLADGIPHQLITDLPLIVSTVPYDLVGTAI